MNLEYTVDLPPELMGDVDASNRTDATEPATTQEPGRTPISVIGLSRPRALPLEDDAPRLSMRDTSPVQPACPPRRSRYRRRLRVRRGLRAAWVVAALIFLAIATLAVAALVSFPATAGAQERPQHLDAATVRAVVRQKQQDIGACYDQALSRNPGLEGKVEVAFDIEPGGSVSNARVESSSVEDAVFANCIVDQLSSMRFPSTPKTVTIRYPFIFTPPAPAPAAAIMADSVGASAFRTALRNDEDVQACYDQALSRNEDLSGRLIVEFTLESSGTVSTARVLESTLDDETMVKCVVAAMKRVSFPGYSGRPKATVRYPFMFKPE